MGWILGAIALLLFAYIFDMGLLIYGLYALVAVLVISRIVTRQWANELVAHRTCDRTEASVGDSVTVMIEIQNKGKLPVLWCIVEDLLPAEALFWKPPQLEVSGTRLAVMRLKSRSKQQLLYRFKCNRRGYYQIGPLVLETGDFFGLHRRFRVLTTPQYLMVLPKATPLDGYEIASKRPIGEVKMSYRIYEDPTRIAGIRRYERGDPLNRVHWRATARTGELHSKVYEPSTIVGATVVLDFHEGSYDPRHEPMRSELAITTAASIANAVYQMGHQIGLVSNGRDAVDRIREEGWAGDARTRDEARQSATMYSKSDRLRPITVPTRKGSEQMALILKSLARLELTDGLSLAQLLVETAPRMPRDASVIVVLSGVSPEIAVSLGNLSRQGYSVTAIINVHGTEAFARASGPLLNEGIETRHLFDETAILEICRRQVLIA